MRTYDIPYVKNPGLSSYDTMGKLEDLDLKTIVKTYLCGKSQGKISECRKCQAQCAYGKRALDLAFPGLNGGVASITLPEGKTLIERAREQTAARRMEQQNTEPSEPEKKEPEKKEPETQKKSKRLIIENWYDKAYESGNPIQWIMDAFGINERKAKQKVYQHQNRHPELREQKPMWQTKKAEESKPAESEEHKPNETQKDLLLTPLEEKINALMNLQAEYKEKAEHYQKLYQETKTKVDALYEALNILNE